MKVDKCDADFTCAWLTEANLKNAKLSKVVLIGVDLMRAILTFADLEGIIVDRPFRKSHNHGDPLAGDRSMEK